MAGDARGGRELTCTVASSVWTRLATDARNCCATGGRDCGPLPLSSGKRLARNGEPLERTSAGSLGSSVSLFFETKPSSPSAAAHVYVTSAAKCLTVNCVAAVVRGVA